MMDGDMKVWVRKTFQIKACVSLPFEMFNIHQNIINIIRIGIELSTLIHKNAVPKIFTWFYS